MNFNVLSSPNILIKPGVSSSLSSSIVFKQDEQLFSSIKLGYSFFKVDIISFIKFPTSNPSETL